MGKKIMKIAFFVGVFFPNPGGVQIQTHNIANTIIKMGHEIDFFILNKSNVKNNLYKLIIINKFIISLFFYLNYYLKINLSFFFRVYLKYILKIEKYDLFHFHFLNHKMIFLIENLKYFKKKIIVTFHGADIQYDKNFNYGFRLDQLYEKLFQRIIFKIDYFFSISESIKKDILNIGINKKKIFSSPNSISIEKVSKFENITTDIKNKIHLLTVARFAKNTKGLDLIPKIANTLHENNINYKWSFVGKNIDQIKKFKDMDKYEKNFKFYGNIQNFEEEIFPNSELIKIYKNNHIYVSLSRIEAFPITLLEALACGLPVLSFNTKGGNELVVDSLNGKLVNEYSANKMAEAIISYQKENWYELHKKNTTYSVLKYDLKKTALSVIEYYKNLN